MKKQERNNSQLLAKLSPLALLLVLSTSAFSQEIGKGDPEILKSLHTDKEFSEFSKSFADEEFKRDPIKALELKPKGIQVQEIEIIGDTNSLKEIVHSEPEIQREKIEPINQLTPIGIQTVDTQLEIEAKLIQKTVSVEDNLQADDFENQINELKTQLSDKKLEIESLQVSISKIKSNSADASDKLEELNGVILKRTEEISSLQSKLSDLKIQIEQDENLKVELDGKIAELETELQSAKDLLAEKESENAKLLKEKEEKDELLASKDEEIESLSGRNKELENITCEQEDRLSKLEEQVSTNSMSAILPLLMQQQMMMTQMMMSMMNNTGFPTTMSPTLSDGSQTLRMEMLVQGMRYENQFSNMQNNMYGMLGLMNSTRPNYTIANPMGQTYTMASGQNAQNQMDDGQSTMDQFNPNFNQDSRNFGNMIGQKSEVKVETKVADKKVDSVEKEDLETAGLGNTKA